MAVLRKWKQEHIEWADLAAKAELFQLDRILRERDSIMFADADGIGRTAVAAKVTPTGALFVMQDLEPELQPMYRHLDGSKLSWEGADQRAWLNTEKLAKLPEDLLAVIRPRKIVQVFDGAQIVTEDMLWVPSATEMFGEDCPSWMREHDGPDEKQLPIFKTEADRVKNRNGETWWYFTRSPLSSSTANFCNVGANGYAYSNSAASANGVCFGFLIGSLDPEISGPEGTDTVAEDQENAE